MVIELDISSTKMVISWLFELSYWIQPTGMVHWDINQQNMVI